MKYADKDELKKDDNCDLNKSTIYKIGNATFYIRNSFVGEKTIRELIEENIIKEYLEQEESNEKD